jgi:hypothetical protein
MSKQHVHTGKVHHDNNSDLNLSFLLVGVKLYIKLVNLTLEQDPRLTTAIIGEEFVESS